MRRPIRIGLTGSIGMGKSTTAGLFKEEGAAVWDADSAVHALYSKDAAGSRAIAEVFPDAVANGAVDRERLKDLIAKDPGVLSRLEEIVHPLVQADRNQFAESSPADLLVFDIPLLFETGSETEFDHITVVSAPPESQRSRVLARPGMTEQAFQKLLERQMPDAEKRARADSVIITDTLEHARAQVQTLIASLRQES